MAVAPAPKAYDVSLLLEMIAVGEPNIRVETGNDHSPILQGGVETLGKGVAHVQVGIAETREVEILGVLADGLFLLGGELTENREH